MLDPVTQHLHHAPAAAMWITQLIKLDPELAAALPLLAARLMEAGGTDGDEDEEFAERERIAV